MAFHSVGVNSPSGPFKPSNSLASSCSSALRFSSARIPDPLIDALIESADPDTGLLHPHEDRFKPGATVTIVNGPLAGLEAIFEAHDGEARSIILLELLGKTRQLKIDRDHLRSTPQI